MAIQAKVVASQVEVATATQQTVQGSIVLQQASNVALDVTADAVASYQQVGADLVVHLKDGETIRIANFYAPDQPPSQLYLVNEKGDLVVTELDQVAADGTLTATYASEPIDAGFESLTGSEAAAAGSAGAAGGIAGLGVTGTILAAAAVIAGGAAIASGGGGGGGGGGSGSNPPATPAPATDVAVSPDGSTISGRAAPGSTVEVDVNGDGQPDYSAPVDGNGNFQVPVSPPLSNGETVTVIVRGPNGGSGSSGTTVTAPDTTAPGAATGVTVSEDGSKVSGSAEPGATVKVDTNGDGIPDASGVAGSDGTFQITLPTPVNNGQSVTVTVTDHAGNTGPATVVSAPDTTPPAPASGLAISADGSQLTGHAEPGSSLTIDLNNDGVPDITVQVGADGGFSLTLNPPLLGGQPVSVIVHDAAGNASPLVQVIAPNPSSLPSPVMEASNGHVIQGTATFGTTVYLTNAQGGVIGVALVGGDGHWSFTPTVPLPDGTVINAIARGPMGTSGTSSVTVDSVAPTAPTIAPSNGSLLEGTAEAGSTVVLTGPGGVPIGTVRADGNGHWSFTPGSALSNGTEVTATACDAAGNTSLPGHVTVDALAPAAPLVNPSDGGLFSGTAEPGATILLLNGNGQQIGQTQADGNGAWSFTFSPPLANGSEVKVLAKDASGNVGAPSTVVVDDGTVPAPVVEPSDGHMIFGHAEPGLRVEIRDANGTLLAAVTADGNGSWSYTPGAQLPNGTQLQVTAVDTTNNHQSTVVLVTTDSMAPAAPHIDASNGSVIAGTGEIGATIILLDGSGNPIGQTTVDANGHWTFSPQTPLANGTLVNAIARDAAGNSSLAGTVTVDTIAPPSPIVAPSNGLVLTGTAEAGAIVRILDAGGNLIGQTSADGSGNWSFTPPTQIPNGSVLSVVAVDPSGNPSLASSVTVDGLAPSVPVIAPSNGSVLSGTAEANARVILTDGSGNPIGQVTADGSGHWSFAPGVPLANGTVVNAVARDAAGNTSTSAQATVDAVAPPAPQVNPSNGLQLSGTAEPGSIVLISDGNGNPLGQVTVGVNGAWSFTFGQQQPDGTLLQVTARDAAGNTSIAASTTVNSALVSPPQVDASNGVDFSGTAEAGQQIVIRDGNGNLIGQTSADGNGHWSFSAGSALANGAAYQVVAVDPGSGRSSVPVSGTVDSVAPAAPTIDGSNGTSLSGSAEAGSTVTLRDGSGNLIGQVSADGTGHWSFTPASPLPNGTVVNAVASDAAGNASTPASTTVDNVAPPTPTVDPSNGALVEGSAEPGATIVVRDAGGNVIGQVTADGGGHWSFAPQPALANGTQLTVQARDAAGNESGTASVTVDTQAPAAPVVEPSSGSELSGTAEANAEVVIISANGQVIAQVPVSPGGTWSYTPSSPLPDGATLSVVAVDSAGNRSGTTTITVDSTPPAAPLVNPSNGASISGTAEPGSTVTATDGSNNPVGQTTADGQGNWSITPTTSLPNGSTVTVVATDAAGNPSIGTSTVVDSSAPSTPVVNPSNGTSLSGTGEEGSTLVFTDGSGNALGQTTVGAGGVWSFTPHQPLADGTVVTVVAKDAAGNQSGTAQITVDAAPPANPTLDPSNGVSLTGTGEIGSTVIISVAGSEVARVVVGNDGHWSYTPSSQLANNTNVSVVAVDAAGNSSQTVSGVIDSVAPPTPTILPSEGLTFSGTAEAGAMVILTDAGGNPIGQTTADADGRWTFSAGTQVPDGTVVNAIARDAAGNSSGAASTTVDADAPAAPLINPSNGTSVSGTAEIGSTITLVYANNVLIGQATTDSSGKWTFSLSPPLPDGTVITVVAQDAAGNTSNAASIVIDSISPPAPTVLPSNGSSLSGTAEAGSTVIVSLGGVELGRVQADINGHWTLPLSPTLGDGTQPSVVAVDAAGNASAPTTVTIDAVAPGAPTISDSNGTLLIGTAEAGSTVILTNGSGTAIGQTTADSSGHWSFTPPVPLPNGTSVTAVAQDAAGNTGPSASVVVDTALPNPPVIEPSNGATISGTADALALVRILDAGGNVLIEVNADGSGHWSWTPSAPLANGVEVRAVVVDGTRVSGVSSVIIDALPPAQPVVQPSNGILLSGSAEAGSVITLLDGGGQLIGSTTADAAGKWSFSPGSPLADGTQVQVLATDAAGNTSIPGLTTIDAVAPAAPVVAPSNGSVLAGTAEANATILLTDGNGNVIGQTTADGSGNWSFTPIAALANGTVVNAVARDAAGNTSVLGSTTIDSVAPGVPTVDPSNGVVLSGTAEANATILITDGNGNPIGQTVANGSGQWSFTPGTPLANGVVVDVVARDAAGNTSGVASTTVDAVSPPNPTIDLSNGTLLSGTAEANATVILTDGNGNPIGQVRADGAGNWSLTVSPALANGTLVNAVARDAAGNTSGPVSTTIDSVAPANPTIAASNGNELHGTAEINATVILTDGNGNLIGQTTANGSGVWSFTPGTALANGTVVNAVARDAVGNTSGAASTTIDSVAPATPTIDPSNGSLLSGTAEANATVILTDGNGNPIGQTTANGSGNWSFTPGVALPDGAVVNVVARDAAGNSSGVATTTVDALPPPTPTVEPSNGTHLAGTAEAGARVILTDGGGNPIGQTTADGSGHWSFNPGTALANGTVVNVQARDAAGNSSGIVTTTVDSVAPPTPTIDPSNGTQLAGTAESSATVILHDGNGNLIGTTQADGSGHWSFTPSPALANGTTVSAVAQDAAGNTSGAASTVVDSQAPNPPVCDPSNGALLSGTGEVGATILISVGGVTLAQVQVDGSGHWNYAPPIGLQDGVQVSVVARDAAGNLSSAVNVTVDAVAPPAPVIASSDGTVFAGTAEANATVLLSIGGSVLAEVKVDANGNWQYVPAVPVGDGVLVSASARDAAGNVGLPGDVTVDASLPAIPVINPSNGLSISGTAEANATVLISVNGVQVAQVTVNGDGSWSYVPGVPLADGAVVSAIARDASSNLSGTATAVVDALAPAVPVVTPSNGSVLSGTAEAGATVILSVGGVPIAQVTADASGHWSYAPGTALANGVQVSVVARDAAGNTSGAVSVTVDSVAPNAPTIAASNGVTFSGTAEANSTVIITGANGALLGQVTTNASGIWSFTPGVPLGNGVVVSVVAKDAAGNVSVAASTTVDAVAPSVPVVTPSNGTVFSGTAEAGSTVILSVGGAVIGQVTANAQGQWSFAPGTAVANNAQVSIVSKDAVGNTSVAASVTVDAVAPTAPIVAPSNGTLLSGTAEIGSTVILKVGGAVIAQVTADGTGHWSFTPGTALANNTQVSVTAKDAAGNVSVATTVSIDSVAPVAPSGLSVSANGTVLTGIAEANSTVKVIINGDTNNPITVQANGSGNFTVNLSPALTAGQVLTVNAVDTAGNVGSAIQIQAPDLTRPVLTIAEAADGYINKTELSDGIQVRVGLTAGAQVGQTLTLRYSGAGGFTYTQAHVLTAAEVLAGVVLVTLLPAAGVGVIPQGTATLTADVNGGLAATPASFTVDTLAPGAPVLSLAGNVLGIGGEVNSTLLVDVNVAGLSSHTELSAGSTGIGSLDLLSGLTGVSLTWDQLLDASVSVASRDAAGNVGNVASINLENVLTQNTVTIGGLGLAVGLLPPTLGISGTAIAGGSLAVQVITPAVNVTLHPIVDATGHFTINLLAADLLGQLGLSVTQILNLGSQLSLQLIAYDASGHQSAIYGISLTGSGLTLAIGEVSVTGTAGADVFLGQNGAEHFYGNAGADLFLHVGTGDIVQAGDGNDTIQLQATNFKSIDGGNGFDTVMLDHGISLNYGAVGTGTWTNIERVDMGKGDAGGSLTLTAAQVDAVTDGNNVLQVTGDSNDTLTVRGAVDTGVNQVHSGISYDVYTFGNTTLLVEENTVHVVVS